MAASTPSTRASGVEALVLAERIYTALRFDLIGPLTTVIGAAVITAFAWHKPGPTWAAGWFAAVVVAAALWIALLIAFRRAEPDANAMANWHRLSLLSAVTSGVVWGC